MAAQSIGEPGTQLTLRTFHIGGTASRLIAQSKETSKIEGVVKYDKIEVVDHKNGMVVMNRTGEIIVCDEQDRERYRYNVPYGVFLRVTDKQKVTKGQSLFEWDPYNNVILASRSGKVELVDLVEGETTRELYDERTGVSNVVVVEHRDKKLHPHVQIFDTQGNGSPTFPCPRDRICR